MAAGIKNRNRILSQLSCAADQTTSPALRSRLRALCAVLSQDRTAETSESVDAELLSLATELAARPEAEAFAVTDLYLSRIEQLLARRAVPSPQKKHGGIIMKLLEKLGAAAGKALGKKPAALSADSAFEQADQRLFALEKNIALTSEKRKEELARLTALVQEATALSPDSFEYKEKRSRASAVRKQISLYEGQINSYYKALMDSQRYQQLLQNGQAMQTLSELLPDPVEADVILESLTKTVEDVLERQTDFTATVSAYENRMNISSPAFGEEDEEFDRAVAAARGELQTAATPAPAEAVPAAAAPVTEEAAPVAPLAQEEPFVSAEPAPEILAEPLEL